MTHASIPTIYACVTDGEANHFALTNRSKGPVVVMIGNDAERIYLCDDARRKTRLHMEPLPSGGFRKIDDGTQYTVVKWCGECGDWKGVDASFAFNHETHVRRSA